MEITKKFHFCAAHRLHKVPVTHPCNVLHGHNYEVEVYLQTPSFDPDSCMIMDYRNLDFIKEYLDLYYDHATIVSTKDKALMEIIGLAKSYNESNPFGKTISIDYPEVTAEILALEFQDTFRGMMREKIDNGDFGRTTPADLMIAVKVSETPNTSATTDLVTV